MILGPTRPILGGEVLKDGTKVEIAGDRLYLLERGTRTLAKNGTYTLRSGKTIQVRDGLIVSSPPILKPASPPPPTVPTSEACLHCVLSKASTLNGVPGFGCRETPPIMWKVTGCKSSCGCCASTTGCLVSGIKGDGIY